MSIKGFFEYSGKKNIKEFVIPYGFFEVSYCAFEGCSKLKNIIIPDSVTKIGDYAFKECF